MRKRDNTPGGGLVLNVFGDKLTIYRHARRLVRLHGIFAASRLGNAKGSGDLGRNFRNDLYESEVRRLIEKEWMRHAEDVFSRRTKNGLYLSGEQAAELETFIAGVTAR